MNQLARCLTLILAACLMSAPTALVDKDKDDKDKKKRQTEASSTLLQTGGSDPEPGQCDLGSAEKNLEGSNVRARLFNTGSIAYGNGAEARYTVPKSSNLSPWYAINIWVGGMVGNDVRTSAATVHHFEFWPGPLGSDGHPVNPNDCSAYDRLYKVSRQDIERYEATGNATKDLADWPYELGAPVIDGDGVEGNYNLEGGERPDSADRPDLIGDQAVWWIMNDVGNAHDYTHSSPIGLEVRVHAFAFNRCCALGDATFFKYHLTYKGKEPLTDAFFTVWSDPDLGAPWDDFAGSDTTLGLGYVYNDMPMDDYYGLAPAAGFDFFQGPVSENGDTLAATSVMTMFNAGYPPTNEPREAQEVYNVQQGLWAGGEPLRAYEYGFGSDGSITTFAYPGDPVTGQFWSNVNSDGNGMRNNSGNIRLIVSTGPFTMQPGESQEIVFGILYARGADNLDSITRLREASRTAQAAFEAGFEPMKPTSAERAPEALSVLEPSIDYIGIVPNPYRSRYAYEAGNEDRRVRFTNMPQTATIRVYTVRGTLVRTLYKDGPGASLDWDMTTDRHLPVTSGMYFIHVEVPGGGEKVMKFGVVNRETNASSF